MISMFLQGGGRSVNILDVFLSNYRECILSPLTPHTSMCVHVCFCVNISNPVASLTQLLLSLLLIPHEGLHR